MKYFVGIETLKLKDSGKLRNLFPFSLFSEKDKESNQLISIALVSEDGREYQAIFKNFNLKEAWNKLELDKAIDSYRKSKKINRIRSEVLKPIFEDLLWREGAFGPCSKDSYEFKYFANDKFNYKNLKKLIEKFGKSNEQISKEIIEFVYPLKEWQKLHKGSYIDNFSPNTLVLGLGTYATVEELLQYSIPQLENPEFYGYDVDSYSDMFHNLFKKYSKLPSGFPYYCKDIERELSHKIQAQKGLYQVEKDSKYPKKPKNNNALENAYWNKNFYEFLKYEL